MGQNLIENVLKMNPICLGILDLSTRIHSFSPEFNQHFGRNLSGLWENDRILHELGVRDVCNRKERDFKCVRVVAYLVTQQDYNL